MSTPTPPPDINRPLPARFYGDATDLRPTGVVLSKRELAGKPVRKSILPWRRRGAS